MYAFFFRKTLAQLCIIVKKKVCLSNTIYKTGFLWLTALTFYTYTHIKSFSWEKLELAAFQQGSFVFQACLLIFPARKKVFPPLYLLSINLARPYYSICQKLISSSGLLKIWDMNLVFASITLSLYIYFSFQVKKLNFQLGFASAFNLFGEEISSNRSACSSCLQRSEVTTQRIRKKYILGVKNSWHAHAK